MLDPVDQIRLLIDEGAPDVLSKIAAVLGYTDAAPSRDAQEAKPIGREPTDAMQLAGAQAIRFDTTPINKIWTANAVFRAMWDAAMQQSEGSGRR